jgi:hypothetical protein
MPAIGSATATPYLPPNLRSKAERQEAAPRQAGAPKAADGRPLSPEEQRQIAELRSRDAEVRAHEAAHQAAGAGIAGAASFTYERGPDGRAYAVGGEVPLRIASGRTPEETRANARQVRAAALAPANPSPQDLAVAGRATELEATAAAQEAEQSRSADSGRGAQARQAYGAADPATAAEPSGGQVDRRA